MNIRRLFYRPRACCSFAVITYAFILGVAFTLIQTASEIFVETFRQGKHGAKGPGETADQSPQLAQIIRRSILNYGSGFQVLPSLFSKQDSDDFVPKDPSHILIITNRRSGSSFLGQLFNQNKNVFFHFEPLKSIEQTISREYFVGNSTKMISDIFSCRFPPKHSLLNFYSKNHFHRMSSRALSIPPICEPDNINVGSKRVCKALKSTTTRLECLKYKLFAIKTIRFAKLQDIEALARDPSFNLKILHLVRDPRGTFTSRAKSEKKETMDMTPGELNNVRYLCLRMKQNLEFVTNKPTPDWLKGVYKIVRYEDMARNPEEMAQELYDFTGLGKLPRHVVEWLRNNTKTSSGNFYAVSRNSSATWQEWRYSIPFETSVGIQDVCRDVLRILGYREVPMQYLLRDSKEDLMKPLPDIWKSLQRPKDNIS